VTASTHAAAPACPAPALHRLRAGRATVRSLRAEISRALADWERDRLLRALLRGADDAVPLGF
jgi:hypothetical protein